MTIKRSTRRPIVIGQRLPPQDLGRVRKLQDYKGQLVANVDLSWADRAKLGPSDFITDDSGLSTRHFALEAIDRGMISFIAGKGTGAKPGKGGKGGKPKWPDPNLVRADIDRMQGDKPIAGDEGNLVVGSLNGEFANQTKVPFFGDTYVLLTRPLHSLHLQEFSKGGCRELEKLTGYHVICSKENSREQAVGIAFHPRCEMIGDPIEYDEFKDVEDGRIPDLRPMLRQDWHDTKRTKKNNGKKDRVISCCVHPKSMLGGPKTTGAIRYQQFDAAMEVLKEEIRKIRENDPDRAWGIVIAGDFNFMAYKGYDEVKPLLRNGFKMVGKDDRRSTNIYSDDSRIDYVFVLGFEDCGVDHYDVLQIFKGRYKRALTDHGRPEGQILSESKDNTSPSRYQNTAGGDSSTDTKTGGSDSTAKSGT